MNTTDICKVFYAKTLDNNLIYIGQTFLENIEDLFKDDVKNESFHFSQILIDKFFKDNVELKILKESKDQDIANNIQKEYVAQFRSDIQNIGYNISLKPIGGFAGKKHSEKTKESISLTKTGVKRDSETCKKLSISHMMPKETEESILKMYAEGIPVRKISSILNVSVSSIYRVRDRNNAEGRIK